MYDFSLFSDQNFGLNDLAAIQDVRNDFNLQDITDEPPASAALTKDRGKFRKHIIVLLLFLVQLTTTPALLH